MTNRKEGVKIQSTLFCDRQSSLPQVTIKRHFATFSKPINSSVSCTTRRPSSTNKSSTNGSRINVPLIINEETTTLAVNKKVYGLTQPNTRRKPSSRSVGLSRKEPDRTSKASISSPQQASAFTSRPASVDKPVDNTTSKPGSSVPQKENVEIPTQGIFILDTVGHQLAFIENSSTKPHSEKHRKTVTKKFEQPSRLDEIRKVGASRKTLSQKEVDSTKTRSCDHLLQYEFERSSKPYNPSDYTEKELSVRSATHTNPLQRLIGLSEDMFQSTSTINLLLSQTTNDHLVNKNFQIEPADEERLNRCLKTLENLPERTQSEVDPEIRKYSAEENFRLKSDTKSPGEISTRTEGVLIDRETTNAEVKFGRARNEKEQTFIKDDSRHESEDRLDGTKLNIISSNNGNKPSCVMPSKTIGRDSAVHSMQNNTSTMNKNLYPIDNYLVPAVIGKGNYLQLSDFRESTSVEHLAAPSSGTPRMSEPKNEQSNLKNLPKSMGLRQTKFSTTAENSPKTPDIPKSTERESKMAEIDRAMQAIRKQIMQSEMDILKIQAESIVKIDSGFSGYSSGKNQGDQKDVTSKNDKNMMSHHETTHDCAFKTIAPQSTFITSEKTCLCCSKPKNSPPNHKNPEIKGKSSHRDDHQVDRGNSYYSEKHSTKNNYQQFSKESNDCAKTSRNTHQSNPDSFNRGLVEMQNKNREYIEKFVSPQPSRSDCRWQDKLMSMNYSGPDNAFELHDSDVKSQLNFRCFEGCDRSPEEFIENEVPQLIANTRSQSRYGSSARLDYSCEVGEGEDICLRMDRRRNAEIHCSFQPNAAVHRVVSRESSTSVNSQSEIHLTSNSKLSRLKKALLPGVNIRSELSVQSGPTIHIPAVSKFSVSSEKNKNVLLKEVVHVETEREVIVCPPRQEFVDNGKVVKNNVAVGKKYDGGKAVCDKRPEDSKNVGGEFVHLQIQKPMNTKVVDKHVGEGLNNNEIQEHLYNAVRTYSNKLNSQSSTKIQKQLRETLQELSFNISRLYNNQMNEYVQCGRSRDVQAPLSYRMKAVAELLWEELELRTYPSEEHYSQIEQIIHHLVHDLEDAIKEDVPFKATARENVSLKTKKAPVHMKNSPLKNNHLDCRKKSTQSRAGEKPAKSTTEKTLTTKFTCSSTSGVGRRSTAEGSKQLERRFVKLSTTQSRPNFKTNTTRTIKTPEGRKMLTDFKRSRYPNQPVQKRPVFIESRKESDRNYRGSQLEYIPAQNPFLRDPVKSKQSPSKRTQICDAPPVENSVFPECSIGNADDSPDINRPQNRCDDEDLMRFKRINTLYKLNKKLHSPNKTIAEIFSAESLNSAAQSLEEKKPNSSSSIERHRSTECMKSICKSRETTSTLEFDRLEDNQPLVLEQVKSIDKCDGEILNSNDIASESQPTANVDVVQNNEEKILPYPLMQSDSEEIEVNEIIRLETVDEETEPSVSNKAGTDCNKSSDQSEKSEKEKDDESYEDDWEIDQDDASVNKEKDATDDKQNIDYESKEVESHHSTEERRSSSSSSSSLSVVSEIKNDDNKSSKSQDSSGGETYVKEKSPFNVSENEIDQGEHLRLNESVLDGLSLKLHSNKDVFTEENQKISENVGQTIENKQESVDEVLVERSESKTFDVVEVAQVDKNNTVTISSSVSSEILQNDSKLNLNAEDFAVTKNTNGNNYLVPLSARSGTTAEMRDSVNINTVDSPSARKLDSCEMVNENMGRYNRNCNNNTMPQTSFHLSIPETMNHSKNKITMTSNFENQEFKVVLELSKNNSGALSSAKSSNELNDGEQSRVPIDNDKSFERKTSKAVNTENISGNDLGTSIRSQRLEDAGKPREVSQRAAEVVCQERAEGASSGVAEGLAQIVEQQVDWQTKSHDLAQLRNRIEGLESTLNSTVGVVLEKLSSDLAKRPSTSGMHVGVSCKLDEIRSSHCQTDDFQLIKATESNLLHTTTEDQPMPKTSLVDEINKIFNVNRGVAVEKFKKPVEISATNKNCHQRKYRTQSSSSQSSSLVSIPRLSGSEEKSQSELSEGEVGMDAAICSCSFGEIKMSGCSRCGTYGVKKLSMKRSYPNLQKSDGEVSVRHAQRTSSDCSGSQSVDSCTKISLDMRRVFKFKSKSLSQSRVSASKSFTNVVENILDELKREKMEARMKFKRSQENFDAQFLKHCECLRRSTSDMSLKMTASVVNHAAKSGTQYHSPRNKVLQYQPSEFGEENYYQTEKPQFLTKSRQNDKPHSTVVISDESGDSEVAIEKLQELDSSSLFRLIRKRKGRQSHANLDQGIESDNNLSNNGDGGKSKLNVSTGKSYGETGVENPDLNEIGSSSGVKSVEDVLKTFFSSTNSLEQELGRTELLKQHTCSHKESSLIRTRNDLLDSDSCNSTIISNTSDDRDRSEGQI
ncbi:uncharacterized protein LOC111050227 isoform X2 [Nilaparvata lugens]|uniref:uncharacterized protein LOC111050227 isoform X2 n=1 Tax=Nilaparvata lugens TaxID=108931 RepID=UPI00193CFA44|nr:uncharacterized protein LOC111050227 isoform X2 [Nilaparvata lugens]